MIKAHFGIYLVQLIPHCMTEIRESTKLEIFSLGVKKPILGLNTEWSVMYTHVCMGA